MSNQYQIVGTQTRKIKCLWGNLPCAGYTNEDETEPFCNQKDVWTIFCNRFKGTGERELHWSTGFIDEKLLGKENEGRLFRYLYIKS